MSRTESNRPTPRFAMPVKGIPANTKKSDVIIDGSNGELIKQVATVSFGTGEIKKAPAKKEKSVRYIQPNESLGIDLPLAYNPLPYRIDSSRLLESGSEKIL